mgnify:CR=1 FL=1
MLAHKILHSIRTISSLTLVRVVVFSFVGNLNKVTLKNDGDSKFLSGQDSVYHRGDRLHWKNNHRETITVDTTKNFIRRWWQNISVALMSAPSTCWSDRRKGLDTRRDCSNCSNLNCLILWNSWSQKAGQRHVFVNENSLVKHFKDNLHHQFQFP